MTNKECYDALITEYVKIPVEKVNPHAIPIEIAINEAEGLYNNALQDKELLATTDLDMSLIDDLPIRALGCKHAQLLWDKVYKDKSNAEEEWKILAPVATDLRDELIHFCKFAHRNDKKLLDRVNRISEGYAQADLVMDLGNLAMLGKEYPEPLQNNGFDLSKLDKAEQLSDECNELLGRVHGARTSNNEGAKDMRDRAYSYLKQAVDAIREAGRFVFWKDEERAALYASAYSREMRRKRNVAESEKA